MMLCLSRLLPRWWYRRSIAPLLWLFLPLSMFWSSVLALRHWAYRSGLLHSQRLSVPVIVIGNLTVGGTGKTPLCLWLVDHLRSQGWSPGVISRGYGGRHRQPVWVTANADVALVGDEPLLLVRRLGVPVVVCRDRVAAGRALLARYPACNVLIADDGLQHLALSRDVEIAVFDARGVGNGWVLPVGPLRESVKRVREVDAVVWNDFPKEEKDIVLMGKNQFAMSLLGDRFVALNDPSQHCQAEAFHGRQLYAVAGIGHPERFFAQLRLLGLSFSAHPFPDHYAYSPQTLSFAQGGVLIMTEKDAVKCAGWYQGEAWVLPVTAAVSSTLLAKILEKIDGFQAA